MVMMMMIVLHDASGVASMASTTAADRSSFRNLVLADRGKITQRFFFVEIRCLFRPYWNN
jgi:hypothetical protein